MSATKIANEIPDNEQDNSNVQNEQTKKFSVSSADSSKLTTTDSSAIPPVDPLSDSQIVSQSPRDSVVSREIRTTNLESYKNSLVTTSSVSGPDKSSLAISPSAAENKRMSVVSVNSVPSERSYSLTSTTSSGSRRSRSPSADSTLRALESPSSRRFSTSSSRRASSARNSLILNLKNQLDEMTNAELISAVTDLEKEVKYLELENMVFTHFLEKNDPSLLEGMESTIKTAQVLQDRASASSKRLTITRSSRASAVFSMSTSSITPMVLVEKEGPRINVTQKTDLILREMEDIQSGLNAVNKKCYIIRHKLKAELEEMSVTEAEIMEMKNTFEQVFINNELTDKFTQTNPADRFCRFMDETFKSVRATIDKLRLRTSSLKVQYRKVCAQLTQKKLLGENLQEVDFEQLHIENKHLREKIDKRNLLLLELKKMNGQANLLLSKQKKYLLKKLDDLKEYQDTIKEREELVEKLDAECDKVAEELYATKDEYDKIKTRSENYQVPPVLEYVKKKAELNVLKKNLKVWARRKQIKDMALVASVREMKNVTGTAPHLSWFVDPLDYDRTTAARASLESQFEFIFERRERLKQQNLDQKRSKRRIKSLQSSSSIKFY